MSEFDDIFTASSKEPEEVSVPPFDKEEWIQQKKAEREHAYEMIDQAAGLMPGEGERVQMYLDLQSRFPRYSVGNILLLSAQKPEATRIADFKAWKEGGVYIKQGETGIIMLEPGNEYTKADGSVGVAYNAKRVFDISQTTAKVSCRSNPRCMSCSAHRRFCIWDLLLQRRYRQRKVHADCCT
ncbi:MAG: ArdC-like ssDNA-binding domain-containing protein [Prevotella sp.]|nr:ArdC-like ssDNA-binding domain-containing protein [Prevotella sp.]